MTNKFETINTLYTTNLLYDHTIKFEMQVLNRTAKTVRVIVEPLSNNGTELPCEIATKRVAIDDNGNEFIIFDDGIVFRADRVAA